MKKYWHFVRVHFLKNLLLLKLSLIRFYNSSFIPKTFYYIASLFHNYLPQAFSILHVKGNLKELMNLEPWDYLEATFSGKIQRVKTPFKKTVFKLKNFLLFGALQNRVERAVYYTFMTFCLEVYNPFHKEILPLFLERKVQLATRLLEKVKKINGKKTRWGLIEANIEIFKRASLLQERVIEKMEKAVLHQKKVPIIEDVKLALKKGLFPLLVTKGLSGTYWMRGTNQEIAGLFKPFDEEAFAPNNPIGPTMQGSLGARRMRPGIRVGESIHREVAAFVVDQFFGFGIVPKTYYATFSHHVFYQATTFVTESTQFLRRIVKTKMGSFQEYIEGFIPLTDILKEEWKKFPETDYQLLILLDVILGNMDRNTGNILVSADSIAAIDHGLCLPDRNFGLSDWYWKMEMGEKPLYKSLVDLLIDFPFEELAQTLEKKCFIDIRAQERMRERVALFREGILAGKTPSELKGLLSDKNLFPLYELHSTLGTKAQEIYLNFEKSKEEEK